MALAAQALEAQKASKPLEQGGALERVAARMKRVMGLTPEITGCAAVRLIDGLGANLKGKKMQKHSSLVAAAMAIAAYSPGIQLASSSQSEDPYKPVKRYRKRGGSPAQRMQERKRLARIK